MLEDLVKTLKYRQMFPCERTTDRIHRESPRRRVVQG